MNASQWYALVGFFFIYLPPYPELFDPSWYHYAAVALTANMWSSLIGIRH